MLTLRKVAVTGGLSCGKTTVCRFFKELGAYVANADEIVHQLLSPNTSLGQQVISLLGEDVLVNDQIDRGKVANKVFDDQELLQSLETLLHPAVISEIEKQYQKQKNSKIDSLFVAEIPLLFEIGGENFFDFTIAVAASTKNSLARFKASTGYSEKEYEKRMKQQLSQQEKAKRADYAIENNGNLSQLHAAVVDVYKKLTLQQ